MIRLTYMLRRKPEMTRAEFQEYWRERHGPLVASHAQTLNMLRYVQVHTLLDAARVTEGPRGMMEEPYDGVAEVWWRTRDDMASARNSTKGQTAGKELVEDEAKFIDFPNSPLWFAYEYPQINPSPENLVATEMSSLVKTHYPLRHLKHLSLEEAQLYWRTNHGPIIRGGPGATGRIKRYIQVHRYEDEFEAVLRQARGTVVEPYTGHAELWADRTYRTPELAIPESVRGGEMAVEDESKFIDFSRSVSFLAKERVFVDYR
ncbi:MAG: EthD domain-containing protein [SAR202 cluster bacterium]|nr:EthD domain-containing protein [SAR202 cluster bacterium]MDP7104161.1 EthD domain-containing protein [SAR202 cluster bacterium]MDP7225844.1 EthD domain-containing protein [SAR202 cluster bacterium]MDP7413701.1 EthD domain-containing protein [SAR202 cluster bacterium]HJO81209.1 EthD domain-containing protein [SAR202 cluster bacterium]